MFLHDHPTTIFEEKNMLVIGEGPISTFAHFAHSKRVLKMSVAEIGRLRLKRP